MSDGHYQRRVLRLIGIWIAVEGILFAIAHFGPAFAPLARSAYVIVAVMFAVAIARERPRSGQDRRHGDRRQAGENAGEQAGKQAGEKAGEDQTSR